MTTAERVEKRIAQRLVNAHQPGSPNEISAAEVREWTIECLRDHDQELLELPEETGQLHWNLWMVDNGTEDALFVVLVFRPSGIEFFCGTGGAFEIRRFAGSEFPDDFELLSAEMRKRFTVPEESLHLSREEAEAWLERGGWCG